MTTLLIIAGLGNVIDTISTLCLNGLGYTEVNPIMSWFLRMPWVFAVTKLGLITGLLIWLWHHRNDKHAKPLAIFAAAVYGSVAAYYGFLLMFI